MTSPMDLAEALHVIRCRQRRVARQLARAERRVAAGLPMGRKALASLGRWRREGAALAVACAHLDLDAKNEKAA